MRQNSELNDFNFDVSPSGFCAAVLTLMRTSSFRAGEAMPKPTPCPEYQVPRRALLRMYMTLLHGCQLLAMFVPGVELIMRT